MAYSSRTPALIEAVRRQASRDELANVFARVAELEDQLDAERVASGQVQRRLRRLQTEQRLLEKRLESQQLAMEKRARATEVRLERLRLDRQLLTLPRRLVRRITPGRPADPVHLLVVCPTYPGGDTPYGGEFVQARVRSYVEAGIDVTVAVIRRHGRPSRELGVDGTTVIRAQHADLGRLLQRRRIDHLAVHHLEEPSWQAIQPLLGRLQATIWVHGFEARGWRELAFNFDDDALSEQRPWLDRIDRDKRRTMSEALSDQRVRKVFVSNFMREVAEEFAGTKAVNAEVIPNVISQRQFPYRRKRSEDRKRILWIRSFSRRNYANDLARDALLELSRRPGFSDLEFTIAGDGRFFDESTAPLHRFSNVTISRGFVPHEQVPTLHRRHGIMLVPTRWDSQGLTCGEAMSSGLVPITNAVAAIPEFVSPSAGMLCPPDDPIAMADAIERLQDDPALFHRMSRRAAREARRQCGERATVRREIKLLTQEN